MAGGLPFKYMGAVMLGQGIAGMASNILRAITLIVWPTGSTDHPENGFIGAMVFFLIASGFMIICAFA
jgi:hypothetical protein